MNLRSFMQMAAEAEGTTEDYQKQLDDWTDSLLLEIEESSKRASLIILEATAKASPLFS